MTPADVEAFLDRFDRRELFFLRAALVLMLRDARRDGVDVPVSMVLLDELARWRLTADQEGSPLDDSARWPDAAPVKLLLTVEDVAEALSVSVPTVKRLVASGRLPSVLEGRRRLVRRVDLESYVMNMRSSFRDCIATKEAG